MKTHIIRYTDDELHSMIVKLESIYNVKTSGALLNKLVESESRRQGISLNQPIQGN